MLAGPCALAPGTSTVVVVSRAADFAGIAERSGKSQSVACILAQVLLSCYSVIKASDVADRDFRSRCGGECRASFNWIKEQVLREDE